MKKLNFKNIGMRAAGVAAGGAGATLINKMLPNMSPKMRALIKIGGGVLLPELAPKSKVLGDAGIAFAGVGAFELANTMLGGTGVQGIGADPEYLVNGDGDYTVTGSEYEVSGEDSLEGVNDALGTNDALAGEDY